jgi:hypothetical protein
VTYNARLIAAIVAVVALGIASVALADGTSRDTTFVDGSVKPAKLDKKKWKPVEMFTGVRTEAAGGVDGTQPNPTTEYISYGKNIKFDLDAAEPCSTLPPSGSTTQQARDACPKSSYIGTGSAALQGPGIAPIDDLVVSLFYGPEKGQIQLHTYSPTLGQAAPTVQGYLVQSDVGAPYGWALSVPHAPETGALMITSFGTTVFKTGAVLARCKSGKFLWQRQTTYNDGSMDTATTEQKCTPKKS